MTRQRTFFFFHPVPGFKCLFFFFPFIHPLVIPDASSDRGLFSSMDTHRPQSAMRCPLLAREAFVFGGYDGLDALNVDRV